MTQKEINDFIVEGKKYSIITSKRTTIVGTVIKISESALTLVKEDNGKKVMVVFSTIDELEECEEDLERTMEVTESEEKPEKKDLNECGDSQPQLTKDTDSDKKPEIEEQLVNEEEVLKSQEFKRYISFVYPHDIDISYGKEEMTLIKKKFRAEEVAPEVWSQIFNRFNSAIKNRALDEKWKGIYRACNEMIKSYPDCLAAYYMTGYFLVKRGEYSKAANCFCIAREYTNESACRIKSNEYLTCVFSLRDALLNAEDLPEDLWYTFVYYAVESDAPHLVLDVLSKINISDSIKQRVIAGLLYLALKTDKLSIIPTDWQENPFSIMQSLCREIAMPNINDPRNGLKMSIASSGKKSVMEPIQSKRSEQPVFEGKITAFNIMGRYGFIDDIVYFYILQVQDKELRMTLLNGGGIGTTISYSFGIGKNGKVANRINAKGSIVNQINESNQHKGYITDYYRFADRKNDAGDGRVTRVKDSKEFFFNASAITTDELRRKLETYRNLENIDVYFMLQGKKAVYISEEEFTEEISDPGYTELPDWEDEKTESDIKMPEGPDSALSAEKEDVENISAEPLFSNELITPTSVDGYMGKGVLTTRTGSKDDPLVRRACDHLYLKSDPNPFSDLQLIKPGDYRKRALFYIKGPGTQEDLEEAEKLFIRSLQTGKYVENDVGDLCTLYLRMGGNYVIKGLQLLEVYGKELQGEKLLDLRVQLIDKSGNPEALADILNYAIKNTVKTNKRLHYTVMLMQVYLDIRDWVNALQCAEKAIAIVKRTSTTKETLRKSKPVLASAYRVSAICYYNLDNMTKADKAANETLKLISDDEVCRRILDRTFMIEQSVIRPEADYADELEKAQESFGLSLFAMRRIGEINIASLFSQMKKVKIRIHEDKYIGNNQEAQKDIHDILQKLQRNLVLTNDIRSQDLLGVAKIAMDARESDRSDNKPISEEQIRSYVGRSMAYLADYLVVNNGNMDVARFCYIEALRYMRSTEFISIIDAFNYLVFSFFIPQEELAQKKGAEPRNREKQIDRYIDRDCLSLKDLVITAFMLNGAHSYETEIMEMLYQNERYRKSLISMLCKYTNSIDNISNKYRFDQLWKAARERFNKEIDSINDELRLCVYENNAHEKMVTHNEKLEEMSKEYYLFNLDVKNLSKFIYLSKAFEEAKYKESVDEREEV